MLSGCIRSGLYFRVGLCSQPHPWHLTTPSPHQAFLHDCWLLIGSAAELLHVGSHRLGHQQKCSITKISEQISCWTELLEFYFTGEKTEFPVWLNLFEKVNPAVKQNPSHHLFLYVWMKTSFCCSFMAFSGLLQSSLFQGWSHNLTDDTVKLMDWVTDVWQANDLTLYRLTESTHKIKFVRQHQRCFRPWAVPELDFAKSLMLHSFLIFVLHHSSLLSRKTAQKQTAALHSWHRSMDTGS